MPKKSSWVRVLAGRVASYAILGGLALALAGALLIAVSGALVGAVLDWSRIGFGPGMETTFYGAVFGAFFGAKGGGIAGLILCGIAGFNSAGRHSLLPPKSLLVPIVVSMTVATLAVMTSYFVGCALWALARGGAFTNAVADGVFPILFAAPAVMVCGEIAGAVASFRREKMARGAAPALPPEIA